MNQGKKFEHNFKQACEHDGIFCLRLADSDLSFNPNKDYRSKFTIKQPCDFLVYYKNCLFALELKNTKGKNFSFQRDPKLPDGMIHYHQINSLINMNLYDGVMSAFLFNFRDEDAITERTFYMSIDDFSRFMVESDKRSINMQDIIDYGGVEITSIKKRTQFTYEVKSGLDDVIEKKGEKDISG